MLATFDPAMPGTPPFDVEIVSPDGLQVETASRLPLAVGRSIGAVTSTDIVIVPSMLVEGAEWQRNKYPEIVRWLRRMHGQGAALCSACSGVLLLAETGLLDGKSATLHWAYGPTFKRNFPGVHLMLEKSLVTAGERQEFVMSGASMSWHDLVLYLTARHAGPSAAQGVARFFALQWHQDGLAPYVVFDPMMEHGDAVVRDSQIWLRTHYSVGSPIDQMVRRSGIPERSFKRRFKTATGLSPIDYVQRLRIEEAKRRLERTSDAIDRIGWAVGYEDPASFRRLFKRIAGLNPGAYRRNFRMPGVGIAAQS